MMSSVEEISALPCVSTPGKPPATGTVRESSWLPCAPTPVEPTGDAQPVIVACGAKGGPWSPMAVVDAEASVTGQTVVETKTVSVVTNVVLEEAGQSWTLDGHAVMVAVRVEKIVDVVRCSAGTAVLVLGSSVAVTGQIVVDTTIVSVVTKVDLAGQLVTELGQAVTVEVRVVRTVEVVSCKVLVAVIVALPCPADVVVACCEPPEVPVAPGAGCEETPPPGDTG